MLRFFYDPKYKYTNRSIIDVTGDSNYTDIDYENIDSPDTINGHIIYTLTAGENIPTYIIEDSTKRWFVSGITQLRTGKFQISLLRDIISEGDSWKTEEAYITAGLATDMCRYKRWDLPFTNTKIRQERLNFGGKSSFFVFYVNEQHINSGNLTEDDLVISSSSLPGVTQFDYTVSNLNEIPNFNLVGAGALTAWTNKKSSFITVGVDEYTGNMTDPNRWEYDESNPNNQGFNNYRASTLTEVDPFFFAINDWLSGQDRIDARTAIINWINSYQTSISGANTISSAQINSLNPYINKYILDTSSNKVYTIRVSTQSNYTYNIKPSTNDISSFSTALRNIYGTVNEPYANGQYLTFQSTKSVYTYTLEEIGSATGFNFTFTKDVQKLPKSAVRCVNIVSDSNFTDSEIAQALMIAQRNGINPDATTGRILDVQFLPFSVATTTNNNLKIDTVALTAQFLDADDYSFFTNMTDLTDLHKETDTIKIVSPSRASQYLFRPYDNDGNMEFTTKVTLKPYASVIYVRPSTKGLLLNDWDDKDCLIINEDFSLTNVSSEWTQYIYNNKNYSSIFERQLQGREYERSWERRIEQANAKSDEWTARNLSAQKAQTYTGNLPLISNIAGAVGTAWADSNYMQAAQLDRQYNEALYQESLDLSRDLFNMQLENIQSQPGIPTKVTAIDCKFLDGIYLEFYSTNDTELAAIDKFYRHNGNRIDNYGTLSDYYGWFVRGKIIRSNNYTQPEIDELNRRLSTGIYTEVNYD